MDESKSETKELVCKMKVDKATALHAEREAGTFYFCSEHCRQKVLATSAGAQPEGKIRWLPRITNCSLYNRAQEQPLVSSDYMNRNGQIRGYAAQSTIVAWFSAMVVILVIGGTAHAQPSTTLQEHRTPQAVRLSGQSYMPVVVDQEFAATLRIDKSAKPKVMELQQALFEKRYDLSDNPSDVMMAAGRKSVQQGVRVKLGEGITWHKLTAMAPGEIKRDNLFPLGFRPLPHTKHAVGGMVFPEAQIDAISKAESRDLQRFDVAFDLPDHLTPEFPPPIFLSSRPDLGDVSQGEVLTIKNYYRLMKGKLTPVQIEGLRLLLTPFPQQQFNQTEDRKVLEPSLGVTCLDCHTNGHTNAAYHLNPDTRPQAARFRLDTVSLRGMFNQQIHGAKRSLRSIEDFTEFEQRTAYFDGDHVIAAKKGVHLPDRSSIVAMMAQMQNLFNFPPAPKLDAFGKLIPSKATKQELAGQEVFFGKGRCAECHQPPFYLDNKMHDLNLEQFYDAKMISDQYNIADGPIKTFTLRGIKDSPPYHHDGRLLTLEDTVEFYNLVLQLNLNDEQKQNVVAFMRCL